MPNRKAVGGILVRAEAESMLRGLAEIGVSDDETIVPIQVPQVWNRRNDLGE